MTMTRFYNIAIALIVGVFLTLPSVALASFPDFGPFEQQTRYLEAGFGIAENFFRETSGQGRTKTLQYLCLTAALVGAAMVIFRKKNQAMGVLIPWIVLVFIMLAGPFGSQLAFVKAVSPQQGGQLTGLMPQGLVNRGNNQDGEDYTGQKGFMPQVMSIHVMSTLHRLFYDYFESNDVQNFVDAVAAEQAFYSMNDLAAGSIAQEHLRQSQECSNGDNSNELRAGSQTTIREGVNYIRNLGVNQSGNNEISSLPVLILPTSAPGVLADLPTSPAFQQGVQELAERVLGLPNDVTHDPSMVLNQVFGSSSTWDQYWDTQGTSGTGPDSLGFFVSTATSFRDSAADDGRRAGREPSPDDFTELSDSAIDMLAAIGDMPVTIYATANAGVSNPSNGNVTEGLTPTELLDVSTCEQLASTALQMALNDASVNGSLPRSMVDLLKSAMSGSQVITEQMMQPYLSGEFAGTNAEAVANYFMNSSQSGGRNNTQATLHLLENLTNLIVNNTAATQENSSAPSGALGMQIGSGNALINGIAQGFVGFSMPVIQLLAPFIIAFSVMVLEFMKIIIDISLMGIIIVTPIMFIMGLLIPSYALGVMILATLCVLVLKMVPVTFTIADAIITIMYRLLDVTAVDTSSFTQSIGEALNPISWILKALNALGWWPSFEQTLLMFAASGIYTGLVGLSLFILFKIGDPSSVSQLASIDGAANKLAALPAKMAMAAATIAAGGGAMAAMGAAGSMKSDGSGGANQTGGAQKAAQDVANKEASALGDMSEEERAEFVQNRTDELLDNDAAELKNLAQTDDAMKELIDQSYGDGSGGLAFEDFGKGGLAQRKGLSNALRTGASESKEFVASAAGSLLPGGGAAVLKQASNAKREGEARTDMRRNAARAAENQAKTNAEMSATKSLAAEHGDDWDNMSSEDRENLISNRAAELLGDGGNAYDLNALKDANYKSDVAGYRQQFGGMIAGGEVYGAGGQSVGRISRDQGKVQAGQLWAQSQASYEMHGINGMSAGDYQIAHSLQARQAAAQLKEAAVDNLAVSTGEIQRLAQDSSRQQIGGLKAQASASLEVTPDGMTIGEFQKAQSLSAREGLLETKQASVSNAKITGDEIAAKVERASDAKVAAYNTEGKATDSTDLQIAADVVVGDMSIDDKMALIKGDKASFEAAVASGQIKGKAATANEIRDSMQDTNMYARYSKLTSDAAVDVMRTDFIAEKMIAYDKENPIKTKADVKARGDQLAKLENQVNDKRTTLNSEFQAHVDSSVRDGIVAEFALKDAKSVMTGGSASKFNVTGDMQAKMTDASYLRSQRFERRQGRNQFAADDMSTTEFFLKDTQGKYNSGKISLADHHIAGSIEKSADGVSSLKSNANAIRRMGDMNWNHHNKLKEIEMESQFRGRIASGRSQSISARTTVVVDEAQAKAGEYETKAIQIQEGNQIIGRDDAGRVIRQGDFVANAQVRKSSRGRRVDNAKARSHGAGIIAPTNVIEHDGTRMSHDEPLGDIGALYEKVYNAKGMSSKAAQLKIETDQAVLQEAALKGGGKAYGKSKVFMEDTKGSIYITDFNVGTIRSGIAEFEKNGQVQEARRAKAALKDFESYISREIKNGDKDNPKYIIQRDANGDATKIKHKVGVSLTETDFKKMSSVEQAKVRTQDTAGTLKSHISKGWHTHKPQEVVEDEVAPEQSEKSFRETGVLDQFGRPIMRSDS